MDRRVLRRLACDAGIVLVATDATGTPMDIGRRDRRLSAALRRALLARDRTCRFPSCDVARHLHAHHVEHWADGGRTDLANLVLLCSTHHRFVHEQGWRVQPTSNGRFTFAPPGGDVVPRVWPSPETTSVRAAGDAGSDAPSDDQFEPGSLQPDGWHGPGGFDLDLTIAVLDQELRRLVSPEQRVA